MKIRIFFFSLVIIASSFAAAINGYCTFPEKSQEHLALAFYNTDNPVHFIVVEKSTQKLRVFEQQQSLSLLKTYDCATGENPGKKIISGDSRTPVGVYFITESYEDKKITVFGSRAFHLDYPNVFDRFAGHLGDGIYIHGTNKTLIPYSTNGCITLANRDLDELADYLTVDTTPVIVVETLDEPLLGKDLRMDENNGRLTEILHELSPAPTDFSIDNVESLSFLTLGSQTVASIRYKTYDGSSLKYSYHKRVYLVPADSKTWRTLYSVEGQDTVPTLLAMHPVKSRSAQLAMPQVAGPIPATAPESKPIVATTVETITEPAVEPIAE